MSELQLYSHSGSTFAPFVSLNRNAIYSFIIVFPLLQQADVTVIILTWLPSFHPLPLTEVGSRDIGSRTLQTNPTEANFAEGPLTALSIDMIPILESTSLHPIPYIPTI